MADETDNETPETPEAHANEEAQAEAAQETQAEEQGGEEAQAESQSEAAPEAQPSAESPAAAAEPAAPSEPEEQLSPKERRRRERSKHTGELRPGRTAEERHAERLIARQAKAARRRLRRSQERAKAAERRASTPSPEPLPPVHAPVQGAPKTRQGIVVSDKASKTITVRIDVARRHRRYEKIVRSSTTLHAHDENDEARIGDVVRVIESRPLSRTKRWKLVDVLERAR